MIKNKAGKEFLGDGQVLDLVYNLLWKTIKDCEIKSKYIHDTDITTHRKMEMKERLKIKYVNAGNFGVSTLLAENDGRLQFAKEVMKLLEDEEEVLDD